MDDLQSNENKMLVLRSDVESKTGFLDLPPEIRYEIYAYRASFRDSNNKHKSLLIKQFQMRYQMLLSFMLTDQIVLDELRPFILGSNTIHLLGKRDFCGTPGYPRGELSVMRYASDHYGMKLPPRKLCPFFKNLKITTEAPMHKGPALRKLLGREVHALEREWNVEEIDWLLPFRELKALGFGHLDRLEIEVKQVIFGSAIDKGDPEEMEEWTRRKIRDLKISADSIDLIFCDGWP